MDKMGNHSGEVTGGAAGAEFNATHAVVEKAEARHDFLAEEKNQPTPDSLHQLLEKHDTNIENTQIKETDYSVTENDSQIRPQESLGELLKNSHSPSDLVGSVNNLRQEYYASIIRNSK